MGTEKRFITRGCENLTAFVAKSNLQWPTAQVPAPTRRRTRALRRCSKINIKKTFLGVTGALCILLSGCQKQMPADAYGPDRNSLPEGATTIDEETYRAYKNAGQWFAITKGTATDIEKTEAAQEAADEATVAEYARAHPQLNQIAQFNVRKKCIFCLDRPLKFLTGLYSRLARWAAPKSRT